MNNYLDKSKNGKNAHTNSSQHTKGKNDRESFLASGPAIMNSKGVETGAGISTDRGEEGGYVHTEDVDGAESQHSSYTRQKTEKNTLNRMDSTSTVKTVESSYHNKTVVSGKEGSIEHESGGETGFRRKSTTEIASSDRYYTPEEARLLEKSLPPVDKEALANSSCRINNWKKGELLGYGAFGSVFLGLDADNGQLMAVKQVHIVKASSDKCESAIAELEMEIAMMQHLSHPNIVAYRGTKRDVENLNIFLEYVPGGSIASLLQRFGQFNEMLTRIYTKQLLLGLEYLHQHMIIHRDIKGANILVDNSGTCKLADFGAATWLNDLSVNAPQSLHGTPYWMAPEVIAQTGHGRQADIWSLGCTVIEMASGKPPWSEFKSAVSAMFHIGTTEELPRIPPSLSPEGVEFIKLCLSRDVSKRPNATRLLKHPFVTTSLSASNVNTSNSSAVSRKPSITLQSLSTSNSNSKGNSSSNDNLHKPGEIGAAPVVKARKSISANSNSSLISTSTIGSIKNDSSLHHSSNANFDGESTVHGNSDGGLILPSSPINLPVGIHQPPLTSPVTNNKDSNSAAPQYPERVQVFGAPAMHARAGSVSQYTRALHRHGSTASVLTPSFINLQSNDDDSSNPAYHHHPSTTHSVSLIDDNGDNHNSHDYPQSVSHQMKSNGVYEYAPDDDNAKSLFDEIDDDNDNDDEEEDEDDTHSTIAPLNEFDDNIENVNFLGAGADNHMIMEYLSARHSSRMSHVRTHGEDFVHLFRKITPQDASARKEENCGVSHQLTGKHGEHGDHSGEGSDDSHSNHSDEEEDEENETIPSPRSGFNNNVHSTHKGLVANRNNTGINNKLRSDAGDHGSVAHNHTVGGSTHSQHPSVVAERDSLRRHSQPPRLNSSHSSLATRSGQDGTDVFGKTNTNSSSGSAETNACVRVPITPPKRHSHPPRLRTSTNSRASLIRMSSYTTDQSGHRDINTTLTVSSDALPILESREHSIASTATHAHPFHNSVSVVNNEKTSDNSRSSYPRVAPSMSPPSSPTSLPYLSHISDSTGEGVHESSIAPLEATGGAGVERESLPHNKKRSRGSSRRSFSFTSSPYSAPVNFSQLSDGTGDGVYVSSIEPVGGFGEAGVVEVGNILDRSDPDEGPDDQVKESGDDGARSTEVGDAKSNQTSSVSDADNMRGSNESNMTISTSKLDDGYERIQYITTHDFDDDNSSSDGEKDLDQSSEDKFTNSDQRGSRKSSKHSSSSKNSSKSSVSSASSASSSSSVNSKAKHGKNNSKSRIRIQAPPLPPLTPIADHSGQNIFEHAMDTGHTIYDFNRIGDTVNNNVHRGHNNGSNQKKSRAMDTGTGNSGKQESSDDYDEGRAQEVRSLLAATDTHPTVDYDEHDDVNMDIDMILNGDGNDISQRLDTLNDSETNIPDSHNPEPSPTSSSASSSSFVSPPTHSQRRRLEPLQHQQAAASHVHVQQQIQGHEQDGTHTDTPTPVPAHVDTASPRRSSNGKGGGRMSGKGSTRRRARNKKDKAGSDEPPPPPVPLFPAYKSITSEEKAELMALKKRKEGEADQLQDGGV